MTNSTFQLIENYMHSCMGDCAHDKEHIYRVLYQALEIAKTEEGVDYDVLICACLLHDIGRKEQFENPMLCHAQVGAQKAYAFLKEHGFAEKFAGNVRDCILTHRYRKANPPQSMEAKILFDADKIDVSGAIGIARTLVYKGQVNEPLYFVLPDGRVSDGENDSQPSFFQEYKYKLEGLYDHFFTERGKQIAAGRREAAVSFYENMFNEACASHENGQEMLHEILKEDRGSLFYTDER